MRRFRNGHADDLVHSRSLIGSPGCWMQSPPATIRSASKVLSARPACIHRQPFRILASLAEHGFVEHVVPRAAPPSGRGCCSSAHARAGPLDIRREARRYHGMARNETGGRSTMIVREGRRGRVRRARGAEPHDARQADDRQAGRRPLHVTAVGKAVPRRAAPNLSRIRRAQPALVRHSITDPTALWRSVRTRCSRATRSMTRSRTRRRLHRRADPRLDEPHRRRHLGLGPRSNAAAKSG